MATPNGKKRKRQTISLIEKQAIIEASKTRTPAQLVTHFNNKYSDPTIRTIIKDKDKILKAIDDGAGKKRANVSKPKHSSLEEVLLIWLKDVRSENVAVDGPMLKVSFNVTNLIKFTAFRKRHLQLPKNSTSVKMISKLCLMFVKFTLLLLLFTVCNKFMLAQSFYRQTSILHEPRFYTIFF